MLCGVMNEVYIAGDVVVRILDLHLLRSHAVVNEFCGSSADRGSRGHSCDCESAANYYDCGSEEIAAGLSPLKRVLFGKAHISREHSC